MAINYPTDINKLNRTIFIADNLDVMRRLPDKCIDLVATDPPFNTLTFQDRDGGGYSDVWRLGKTAKWEHYEEIPEQYKDQIKNVLLLSSNNKWLGGGEPKQYDKWTKKEKSDFAFIIFITLRIIEIHRILKDTGSLYWHCDYKMSHYIKIVLDIVFGKNNFQNEIIWQRTSSHNDTSRRFGNIHDNVFFYSKNPNKYTFNADGVKTPLSQEAIERDYRHTDKRGRYTDGSLTAESKDGGGYKYEFHGITRLWTYPKKRMLELEKDNRIHFPIKKEGIPRLKTYLHEHKGVLPSSIWTDIAAESKPIYKTQKPIKLLKRIIEVASKKGEMVLDPFCGCTTTCVASQILDRQWIGIDINKLVQENIKRRLKLEGLGDWSATDNHQLNFEKSNEYNIIQENELNNVIGKYKVDYSYSGKRLKTAKDKKDWLRMRLKQWSDTIEIKKITYYKCFGVDSLGIKCGQYYPLDGFEVDRIKPKGDYIEGNIQPLCSNCNRVKSDRM